MTNMFSWQNSLSLCPASFCTPKPNLPVTQSSPDFLLLHSSLLWLIGRLFLVLVLGGFLGLHRTDQLQFLWYQWLCHKLGLLWFWMICLGNKLKFFFSFVVFKLAPDYCILESFLDYEGYSTSSMIVLASIVDIMVIWIKFTYSHAF